MRALLLCQKNETESPIQLGLDSSSRDSRMMVTIILESFEDGGFIFIPKRSETWVLRSLQTTNKNDDQGPTFSHRRVAATQLLPLPTLRTPGETQCPFVALHSWSFGCFISWCPEIWWLIAKEFWGHSSFFFFRCVMCVICFFGNILSINKTLTPRWSGDLDPTAIFLCQNSEVWFCHDRNYNAALAEFLGEGTLKIWNPPLGWFDWEIEIKHMKSSELRFETRKRSQVSSCLLIWTQSYPYFCSFQKKTCHIDLVGNEQKLRRSAMSSSHLDQFVSLGGAEVSKASIERGNAFNKPQAYDWRVIFSFWSILDQISFKLSFTFPKKRTCRFRSRVLFL